MPWRFFAMILTGGSGNDGPSRPVPVMAVTEKDLQTLDRLMAGAAPSLARLRTELPHLRLAVCDAADLDDPPMRRLCGYDLHLLDATSHCMRVIQDAAEATGLLLARRSR